MSSDPEEPLVEFEEVTEKKVTRRKDIDSSFYFWAFPSRIIDAPDILVTIDTCDNTRVVKDSVGSATLTSRA